MVRCAAATSAGSFVQAVLSMATLLRLGVANRAMTSELTMSNTWTEKYCIQFKITENCEQTALKIETDCLAHFDDLAAATGRVAYGQLRFSRKNALCKKHFVAKEDIIYDEQNRPPQTIRLAVEACEPKAMDVCVQATCPTYCAFFDKTDCDCPEICERTSKKMWGTGSIDCGWRIKWSDCINDLQSKLKEDKRIAELEAISREHILKCVCVSRLKDDAMCYQGGQGITEGQNWCEFNKNPSWRRLLQQNKPPSWQSDWKPGHEPTCSRKEVELA